MRRKRGLVLVNNETQEVRKFDSVNAAARFLGSTFGNVQIAMFRFGGVCNGWRVYEGSASIRERIEDMYKMLEFVEALES